MSAPDAYRLDHLERLSDDRGQFEHADHLLRREEHGYCTDDNARLLLVTSREPDTGVAHRLGRLALRFVLDAQDSDGRCHNRMNREGDWSDELGTDDCWGRSVWALGVAAASHPKSSTRRSALTGFNTAVAP